MSKIDELIKELCPDGVEWFDIGILITKKYIRMVSSPIKLFKKDYKTSGLYPIIDQGQKFIIGYTDQESFTVKKGTYVIFGDHTESLKYVDFAFSQGADGIKIIDSSQDILNAKYLYYALNSCYKKTGKYARHFSLLKKTIIPLPPLPVQQEIVAILDKFTQLEAELKEVLAAELEARKKQYEYYRNKLLTPEEVDGKWMMNGKEVEWKKLGDIGKICMCKRIMKHETQAIGEIPFYKIGTFGKKADAYITEELYKNYKNRFSFPNKGEILISASGTIGRTVIYNGEPAYFQDSNIVWVQNNESIIKNKFLFYYYKIVEWKTDGGTISRLYNENLAKTKIPILPLEEQERIVAILDKFDALVNDISAGLPAEIDARRKQYEYYRNQLLQFPSR